jgi:flagellar biosynthesis protein FlhF
MHVKSFFAATVEAALAEGSRELGPEALIVQSRKAPPEAQHLGRYEVVLGVVEPRGKPAGSPLIVAGEPAAQSDPLAREMAQMRRQLDSMRRSLSRASSPVARTPSSATPEIFEALVDSETEMGLAQQIAEAVAARLGSGVSDRDLARRTAAEEIGSRFRVDATLGRSGAPNRIAAVVGPPGSGKTTTLVKLAVLYGLAARRPALLISADTYRIGAADQLRSFAAILGIGFELVETPRALDQALELHRAKELILIDTPGLAAAEMEVGASLAGYIAKHAEIDTHLVLSASMKSADITRAVDRFEVFRPAKLLFTRLDETCLLGPVLSEASRTGKPLSFFAAGQQIPEDLEPATKNRMADLVLSPEDHRARAAA